MLSHNNLCYSNFASVIILGILAYLLVTPIIDFLIDLSVCSTNEEAILRLQ